MAESNEETFGDAFVLLWCEAWKEGQTDDEKQASCLDLRPIKMIVIIVTIVSNGNSNQEPAANVRSALYLET